MVSMMRACVLFVDSDWWPLRALKPGFRHCAVVVNGVMFDHMSHWLKVSACDVELPCVHVDVERALPPHRSLTCVGFAKCMLGIRAWWVLTPWQLCRHLEGLA